MKLFLLTFFISCSFFAQDIYTVKAKTDTYSGLLTAEKLAKKINTDFTSDDDKVKALFCWLTENIRYDLDEFYNPKNKRTNFRYRTLEEKETIIQGIKDKKVSETLTTRKGVCEGYAQTFAKVSSLLNIENEVIRGYARGSFNEIGKPLSQPNHAWNAVKLNNKWIYIDATWGAGHEKNGKWLRKFKPYFYDMKKETYFKTHLPEESIWRLRVGRMDKTTFYNQPIYTNNFLETDYELVMPKSGILKRDSNGKISVSLKNVDLNRKIFFGFMGEKFAHKATVITKNGVTTASVVAPPNTTLVFLLIDLELMLSFKII